MGYWVVHKRRNFSLILGIVGLVLCAIALMTAFGIYLYNKAH